MMRHASRPPAIAVIGLACRYPEAVTPRQLWENILARRRQFRRIPDCRLPLADYYDAEPKAPDKTYGRRAAVIDGFDFDWAGLRIPVSTVQTTDMVHWLALETSLDAVADAGYTAANLPGERTGVIIGNTLTGEQTRANTMRLRWPFVRRALHSAARAEGMDASRIFRLTQAMKERYLSVFPAVDEDTLAGGLSNTIAGRICNYLNLMGGGFTVDGACASSLLAVAHAASRMADQDLELAIVGGVDISLDPFELVGFAKTGALTDGDMAVYDRGGKGFIPGEGCGFMVLKPLTAARQDGNPVYAVIHGWGVSSDGRGAGITAPRAAGQVLALQRAYERAPYKIADLDFIEGHGTGTAVGDRVELEAIARVLGRTPLQRGKLRPCGITSLKSIIGHTKAASGIGGLIKAVMAVNRRVVPPTAACYEPHHAFDQAARQLYPIRQGRREAARKRLRAGVSSMGFGGINCHITLVSGDPPDDRLKPTLEETMLLAHSQASELLLIGTRSQSEMLKIIAELTRVVEGISVAELADLSAHLSRQLPSEPAVRAALIAGDPDQLSARLAQLEQFLSTSGQTSNPRPAIALGPDIWLGTGNAHPRVGFLFPGQGSQRINMAWTLVQRFAWAQSRVRQVDRMTRELTGVPLSRRIFRDTDRAPSPEEKQRWFSELSQTEHAQPAICLASILWLEFFSRLGVRPEAVGGHSLGELTAFHAAGVFDAATLLNVAVRRGGIMANQPGIPGAMVSLQCDEKAARALLPRIQGHLSVANLNSPRQTVLSGEAAAAEAVVGVAREVGIGARMLPVSGAFHSRLCQDAAQRITGMALLSKPVPEMACRIVSSVDGARIKAGLPLNEHFSRQIRSRVDFMRLAAEMGACCDLLIEIGPGRVLTGLVADLFGDAGPPCLPVEGSAGNTFDLHRALAALFASGAAVHWETLFENRLIRPFVAADKKSFVTNPCEALPRSDAPDPVVDSTPEKELCALLAEAFAGVPPPVAHRYLGSRRDFLNRIVRADLSFWDPNSRPSVDAAEGQTVLLASAESTPSAVQAALFRLISEGTGFPPETLSRKARLIDDLNLDSIKAGDLIARFAKACGVAFPDPTLLTNAALGDLIDAVTRLGGHGLNATHAPAADVALPDTLAELMRQAACITGFSDESLDADLPIERGLNLGPEKLQKLVERTAAALGIQPHLDLTPLLSRSLRQISVILNRMRLEQHQPVEHPATAVPADIIAGQPAWVRNFNVDLVKTPYPQFSETWRMRSENDWRKARVLILSSTDTAGALEALRQHLFSRGAWVHTLTYDADGAADQVQNPEFSHLLALLPKTGQMEKDRPGLLQRLIRMRASVVSPPPAAKAPRRRTTVAWIQFGGGFFGRKPPFAHLESCAAVALGASLHLERADLRVRVIDFSPALPAEIIAWETLAELITLDAFSAVGYDHDRIRRTFCARPVRSATYQRRSIGWSHEDVILVTGGAKGITAECALAVAQQTGARMVLVGRTPHPDSGADKSASSQIRTLLDRYAGLGLQAVYFACDVTDRDAVARMLTAVAGNIGPVSGIIHGAGANRPRTTGQVQVHQAVSETAPKVLGLLNLLDALEASPPKLIVGLGSIIGITGMAGNGWYGFSNEVMDIALRRFAGDHPQTATVNAAYSIWRDQGMGVRLGSVAALRSRGIDAIATHDGVERFLKIFTHDPGRRQVVITARLAGLGTWPQTQPEAPRGFRFLDHRVHMTPGVEAVFATRLSLETDPYLQDHHFQGSFLFPTVFGLEAMVQAAVYLIDHTQIVQVQIRDVRLNQPISVDPQTGAEIVIRVVLAETQVGGETVVRAGIRKLETGDTQDAFSATFVFGPTSSADTPQAVTCPPTPLPLVPRTDLYRPGLLFQGPRFQAIETVWAIRSNAEKNLEAVVTARLTETEQRASAAFGSRNNTRLCLGDLFFCDTLLQSAALLAPQDTSLPISIDRMDLLPGFFSAASTATLHVTLVGREQRELVYRVAAVSENGTPMAVLTGYRLRILKHHSDYPTAVDLMRPQERDRRLVDHALEAACQGLAMTSPHLELAVIPNIHDLNQPDRRKLTQPILEQALGAAARRYQVSLPAEAVDWLENGKPAPAHPLSLGLDVSITHDDRICLCVCGPGPVGCDLATVTARDQDGWTGLLGTDRIDLLEDLVGRDETLDSAGTRIWAAVETLIKAGVQSGATLTVKDKKGDAVLFAAETGDGQLIQILTLTVRLTWGAVRILAVTVADQAVPRVPEHLLTADYPGYEPLYATQPFEMIEGGPQGQLVFVQRLPVTFQPSANLSRTIYFSNYIKWMGNTREASAWPVLSQMANQFASGRWGGVTNYGHLKILGEARTSDCIEILMWVSDNGGPENATMTLSYDFRQLLPQGGCRRLAFCRLQTTWVEILGPGVARVAPYPAYYGQFIADMCPRFDAPDTPESIPESLAHLFHTSDAPVLFSAPIGPAVRPILREQTVDTSLAHANLVGNVYYANYYEWQGHIRDHYFYELIPDYYHGTGQKGELLALESRVDHLREAMPFDRILITMALQERRSSSVVLHLDYMRLDPNGSRVKLATGMHRAVWVIRDAHGRPAAAPFPARVQAAFDKRIHRMGLQE